VWSLTINEARSVK